VALEIVQGAAHDRVGDHPPQRPGDEAAGVDVQIELDPGPAAVAPRREEAPITQPG
jgi:hypothetical protein